MIPLFGCDKDKNILASEKDIECFINKQADESLVKMFDDLCELITKTDIKKNNIISIITSILLIITGLIIIIFIYSATQNGLFDTWVKGKYLYLTGIIVFLLSAIIKVILIIKNRGKKTTFSTIEAKAEMYDLAHQEFFYYSDIDKEIDIIVPIYEMENNDFTYPFEEEAQDNVAVKIYLEKDNLCIITTFYKFYIPLSSIVGFDIIQKPILIKNWNKRISIKDPLFKDIVIKKNDNTCQLNEFGRVIIKNDEKTYFFDVMPYDFEIINQYIKK